MCTLFSVRPASASGRRKSHISDACARGGRPLILTSTPLLPGGWEALITGGEGGRWAGGGSTYVGLSVLASLGAFRELGSLEVCGRMRWGPATKEATKKQEKLDRKDWNFFALKQQMIGSHKHQKKTQPCKDPRSLACAQKARRWHRGLPACTPAPATKLAGGFAPCRYLWPCRPTLRIKTAVGRHCRAFWAARIPDTRACPRMPAPGRPRRPVRSANELAPGSVTWRPAGPAGPRARLLGPVDQHCPALAAHAPLEGRLPTPQQGPLRLAAGPGPTLGRRALQRSGACQQPTPRD